MSDISNIPNNKFPNEPSLKDVLDLFGKDLMIRLNCHAIATVQSFDPDTQTVTATIAYKKTYFQLDGQTGVQKPVLVDYPLMVDVPVVIMGGGLASLTFPISQGDDCLILFNDRDMDNWYSGQSPKGVATGRLHSFSDAVALVGLRSSRKHLSDYDITRAILQFGSTLVGVSAEKVKIANATTTLLAVIDGLIDVIKGVQTIPASVGTPLTLSPTSIAQLESYKTTVGGLLE